MLACDLRAAELEAGCSLRHTEETTNKAGRAHQQLQEACAVPLRLSERRVDLNQAPLPALQSANGWLAHARRLHSLFFFKLYFSVDGLPGTPSTDISLLPCARSIVHLSPEKHPARSKQIRRPFYLSGAYAASSSRASSAASRSGLVPPAKHTVARSIGAPGGSAYSGRTRSVNLGCPQMADASPAFLHGLAFNV